MAYRAVTAWENLQKVNFDLSPVAQGSTTFNPQNAVAAMSGRPGVNVQQADIPATGDLFLEGLLGNAVPGTPEQVLSIVGSRIASETLGIPPGSVNLKLKHAEDSLTGSHVKGEQTVGGLPVYGSEISVHLDLEGRPYSITGRPFPEALGTSLRRPSRPHRNPVSVASEYIGAPLNPRDASVDHCALLINGEFVACFQVKAATWQPLTSWMAFVTFDGEPLAAYNIASALYGEAEVFTENPLRGSAVRSRLDNLMPPGPTRLQGSYATVQNHGGSDAVVTDGAFFYPVDDPRFDEANLYLYLDQVRISFEALTRAPFSTSGPFTQKANFNPMCGFVHVPGEDNEALNDAFYNPSDGRLYFGDIQLLGDSNVRYTSRSRDIAIHEFAHAVSDSICRLGRTTLHTQSRAMSEGYSDYFAASFLNNPVMGDYFMDDPAGFRNCDNTSRFPAGYAGEEHDVGEVWAGFLWNLRQDENIGRGVTDVLALESLHFLGPWRTIIQGQEAVVLADRRLFPANSSGTLGRHEERIRQLFDLRRPP